MRSQELDLAKYNTDKINNRYLEWYDPFVQHLVSEKIKLLELGVHKGGSLLLWRDYFPKALIVGIDIQPHVDLSGEKRIRVFKGAQQDTAFLAEVAKETAPEGFDVIIDDASHFGDLTRTAFWELFDHHLKPSGIYVIEDWGTGFWDDWPDGKAYRRRSRFYNRILFLLNRLGIISRVPSHSHGYGMVGFIKELIDEQGAADLSKRRLDNPVIRESKFASMMITPSIVFITKRPIAAN